MSELLVRIKIGLCLGFTLSTQLFGQSTDQVLKVADELYEQGQYYGSIGFYRKAMEIDSSNAEVLYKYARNLSEINSHEKASRYFLKSSLVGGDNIFPHLNFELGRSYHMSGEYRKARRYYNRAIRPYRKDRKSYWYKKIDQAKDASSWALKMEDQKKHITIENAGSSANSNFSDFAAITYNNKLYFTAMIADSITQGNRIKDKHYYSRIYTSSLDGNSLTEPLKVNESDREKIAFKHMANLSISDDRTAYFSLCDTNFTCEIWKAELHENTLSSLEKLNNNINYANSNNTQAQIVRINDQSFLYFVSNRERGFGGLDIWVSQKEDFGFGKAINLGANINTAGNEITPHYSTENQTLYFSSDWHYGFGGYDIFESKGEATDFKKPSNLLLPINSSRNDYYFFLFNDSALITSNRKEQNSDQSGSCCNDVYKLPFQIQPQIVDTPKVPEVTVNLLNQYLPLKLYFHNDIPDPNSRDSTTNKNYLSLAYDYLELEGEYLEKMEKIIEDETLIDQLAEFFESGVESGIKDLEFFTPLLLEELKKGSDIELNIKGYASSISEASYNLNLTLRRIESLINYIKSYQNGAFIPYLNKTASNKGSLKINKIPFGEFASKSSISEDNKTLAVYSLDAALQRKIEIIAVTKSNDGDKRLDDNTEYKTPKLTFNTKEYKLGAIKKGDNIERFFLINNSGNAELNIYNISDNCDCTETTYPQKLGVSENGRLSVTVKTAELPLKPIELTLTVVSNATESLQEIKLNFELIAN